MFNIPYQEAMQPMPPAEPSYLSPPPMADYGQAYSDPYGVNMGEMGYGDPYTSPPEYNFNEYNAFNPYDGGSAPNTVYVVKEVPV